MTRARERERLARGGSHRRVGFAPTALAGRGINTSEVGVPMYRIA